jgi:outer membrane receptor for ferrienterochelin and colicins
MKHLASIVILSLSLFCYAAVAQQASITGKVTHAQTGEPLAGVHVSLRTGDGPGITGGDYTGDDGIYRITNVAPGSYELISSYIGCKHISRTVQLEANKTVNLDIPMAETIITMDELVVTASRRDEKLLEAPATISVIPSRDIVRKNTLSPVEHIRGVQGVDVQQKGIMAYEYAARGLNNVFNGNVRTLTDNRMTNLPSLRANIGYLQHTTNQDIDRIEMVLGPGSALYGPNVTNGVMHTITKSPFASRGTNVGIMGGTQGLFGVTARNAGLISDKLGYKVSAQYTAANDWEHTDSLASYPDDLKAERYTVDARLDYLVSDDGVLTLNGGHSTAIQALDLTDNGAVMAKNFSYSYAQAKLSLGDFFVQTYINRNDAGNTYLISENQKIIDKSEKIVAEMQHSTKVAEWQRFIYGVDMFLTNPKTEGTIMGANEDFDKVSEFGGYLQSETKLPGGFATLLLAGRIDKHSELEEAVVSPRIGLIINPIENHSFRATYNRAYMTPVISELFLDMQLTPDIFESGDPDSKMGYGLQNRGMPSTGFTFNRSIPGDMLFYSEFAPQLGALPVSMASTFWEGAAGVVALGLIDEGFPELAALLMSLPNPTAKEVGGALGVLNIGNARSGKGELFDAVTADDIKDLNRLKPTILNNMEIGYTGKLSSDIQVGASAFYSEYEDFISTGVITPNAFLDEAQTLQYLKDVIPPNTLPPEVMDLLASSLAGVPLGTVTPNEAKSPTDLIMAPVNYGTIDYWGADISLLFNLTDNIAIGTNYSYISKNYFDDVDGKGALSLNVPKHKVALSLHYTHPATAIHGSVRYRFNDKFKVKSGIYEGDISPYGLVDLALSAPLPLPMRPTLNLNVNNVLGHKHREYIGGGNIGRLITAGINVSI